eukprot:3978532-Karenia_brevis.AAC.1
MGDVGQPAQSPTVPAADVFIQKTQQHQHTAALSGAVGKAGGGPPVGGFSQGWAGQVCKPDLCPKGPDMHQTISGFK